MNKIIVNNNLFEYEISDKEEPVFIFLSGYDESLESWVKVRSEMEKLGKVFVYNRLNEYWKQWQGDTRPMWNDRYI